ncbi:MAG: PrsW family intramembrane metalloprotease [Candidatus Staskawiczbacteria bacterium]|nr:PrsW family intramembrane metalloprotease [Candidatus Staskawiczbacteria bacterium]
MELYRFILYVLFGTLPSLIWLLYYLKKDLHPEPKRTILEIFLLGCLVTIPVYFSQIYITQFLGQVAFFSYYPLFFDILKWFVAIAFIEELFKFFVVKLGAFRSGRLDEPVDLMIYMVVSALGFAAVENILYLAVPLGNNSFSALIQTTAMISFIRFIGATFLHTLCSALLGYFLVLGVCKSKRNIFMLITGLALASGFHGLYNFSIVLLPSPFNSIIPITIIMVLFIIMVYNFSKVKKLKSICKI